MADAAHSGSSSGSGRHPAGRPPLWLIFTITATGITGNTIIASSLPEILTGVGAAPAQAGLLLGAATLPGVFLAPVIGVLADRYGRRRVLIPCLTLFGLAGGLGGLAPSIGVLIALRFLQGVGSSGLVSLAVVLIGDHWQGRERVAAIGRNAAVLTVCLTLFPLIGGLLTDLGGWQAPFAVFPLSLVTAVLIAEWLPKVPRRRGTVGEQLAGIGPILRSREFLSLLSAGFVFFALIFGVLLTVLPFHLESVYGLSPSGRGVLLGIPALANTLVAVNLGRLHRRFARGRQMVAGGVVIALGLGGAAGAPTLAVIVVALAIFGAGEGLLLPNLQDAMTSSAEAHRGTVVAVFVSAARLGQTAGPVVAGAGLGLLGALPTIAWGGVAAAVLLVPLLAVGHWERADPGLGL